MRNNPSKRYAVVPDRLWDGNAESVRSGLAVVVDGGKIAEICPAAKVSKNETRLDLAGATLMPGLIDSHTHYTSISGPLYLAAGVTTIRDTGNDLEWILRQREETRRELSRGPRILCCGMALDGPIGIWKNIVKHHNNEDSLRTSIRENASRGVDAIKLYANLDGQMLRAGVEEAHALGMFALSHLNETSAEDAAQCGLNEIEHFSRCDIAWKEANEEEDDRLIDLFLERGVFMNPTLGVWDRLGRAMDPVFLHDERRKWVHPTYLEIWERVPYRRCEPAPRLRYQALIPNLKRFLLRCHQREVVILAGTDSPLPYLIPGFSLHDELASYVDAGIPPVDALRSATSVNARVLGLESEIGRIAPGMNADMVAVEGNPLERIDDLANVKTIIREGLLLDPGDLLKQARNRFEQPVDDPLTRDLLDYVSGEMPAYKQKG